MNQAYLWITVVMLMVGASLFCEYKAVTQSTVEASDPSQMSALDYWAGLFKALASLGFLAYFYDQLDQQALIENSAVHQVPSLALGVALVASAVGDVLLVGKKEIFFLLGLIAFFMAHLAYAFAFVYPLWQGEFELLTLPNVSLTLLVGGISVLAFRYFKPYIPHSLLYPAMAYTTVIGLMMSIAFMHSLSLNCILVASGAFAFWLSDLAVAKQQFQADQLRLSGFYVRLWGLPLYYIAQLILASEMT